jgi:hypothetical protein
MAKELPYFRFTVQEWQNGDISLESYELRGLFIDVCGFYWIKDCSITLAMLNKRYKDATELIKELLELNIIKHDIESDEINIFYLDEQYDLLSNKRKKRSDAGKKGGLAKSSNAKAKLKQNASYKDKDKDKDKENKEIELYSFLEFWEDYDYKTGKAAAEKSWKKLTPEEKTRVKETVKDFRSYKQFPDYQHPMPSSYLNQKRFNDEIETLKEEKIDVELYVKNHLTYDQQCGEVEVVCDNYPEYNGLYYNRKTSKFQKEKAI